MTHHTESLQLALNLGEGLDLNGVLCPAVCREVYFVDVAYLPLLIVTVIIAMLIIFRKRIRKKQLILALVASMVLLLLSFDTTYNPCASGCISDGFRIESFRLLPDWLWNG